MKRSLRGWLRGGLASLILSATTSAFAIDSLTITSSALSPDCLSYRVTGICFWLFCSINGCDVRTSVKVRHYVPDAVVSSYSNTGANPWDDVAFMSPPNASARQGGDATTNERHENNLAKFRNADVVGHPATLVFSQFAQSFGYSCEGVGQLFSPYLLSTFDTIAWRHYLPEMFYPEALIPGLREIGSRAALETWGSVYPRGGFLHQVDDYKAAAVVAQRAGDIVTRRGQPHVYRPLLPLSPLNTGGYWPAGDLVEGDESTGKWQELVPRLSSTCAVFPNRGLHTQAIDGGYAWALWRPYSCCRREGQVFLFSVDFDGGISR
jgi:integrating conjugative element protein (TIGR03756 family)